jgi:3-hydroxybutyryl-CoA dehydratase
MHGKFEGYFEDFNSDLELVSPTLTVSEGMLANYLAVSGDYNQIYTSDKFAKESVHKGRVLPSLMIFALATGLFGRINGTQDHGLAMLGQRWEFHNFARVGDTLVLKATFPTKRETRHRDRGIVTRNLKVFNQAGELIASTEGQMMQARYMG